MLAIGRTLDIIDSDLCWEEIWVPGRLWILIEYPCTIATAAELKAVRWIHSLQFMTFKYQLIHIFISFYFLFFFLFIYESVSSIFPIYVNGFLFSLSLSVLPPSYPASSVFTFLPSSHFLIVHPSLSPFLPITPASLFGIHLCCIRRDMLRERDDIKKEDVENGWALHYNGELSQGRFVLLWNDASICIYSPKLYVRSGLCAFISLPCGNVTHPLLYACVLLNICNGNLFYLFCS